MNQFDPIILIPVLCAVIFLCGYLAAWCRARAIIRRYERSYGSLITRSR